MNKAKEAAKQRAIALRELVAEYVKMLSTYHLVGNSSTVLRAGHARFGKEDFDAEVDKQLRQQEKPWRASESD